MRNSRRLAPSSSSLRSDALRREGREEVNGDTDLLCDEEDKRFRGFQNYRSSSCILELSLSVWIPTVDLPL